MTAENGEIMEVHDALPMIARAAMDPAFPDRCAVFAKMEGKNVFANVETRPCIATGQMYFVADQPANSLGS
jgi:hypothetical protein